MEKGLRQAWVSVTLDRPVMQFAALEATRQRSFVCMKRVGVLCMNGGWTPGKRAEQQLAMLAQLLSRLV